MLSSHGLKGEQEKAFGIATLKDHAVNEIWVRADCL